MISWKVQNPLRLLTEVKNKFSGSYTVKDIRFAIEHNRCFVNHTVERFGSTQLKRGDTVSIILEKRIQLTFEPERILFDDEHLLAYNKPSLMTTEQLGNLSGHLLVHRLDRDTTGIILLAKTPEAQSTLEDQFRQRTIVKEYLAIVHGNPGPHGTISLRMAPLSKHQGGVIWGLSPKGLSSLTEWKRIRTLGPYSLISCFPKTGRTHQIRVHLAHISHPIVGDPLYGPGKPSKALRPLLHASTLHLSHPITGLRLTIMAPPPNDFPSRF